MQFQTIQPEYGVAIRGLIQPGRAPWLLLVPSMEAPELQNVALIEFMRAKAAVTGRGFASFLPAVPARYDDTAHSVAAKALLREAVAVFGQPTQGIIAAAPREQVVMQRTLSASKGMHGVLTENLPFAQTVFQSLPARHAFAKKLGLVTQSIRNQGFGQLHHP